MTEAYEVIEKPVEQPETLSATLEEKDQELEKRIAHAYAAVDEATAAHRQEQDASAEYLGMLERRIGMLSEQLGRLLKKLDESSSGASAEWDNIPITNVYKMSVKKRKDIITAHMEFYNGMGVLVLYDSAQEQCALKVGLGEQYESFMTDQSISKLTHGVMGSLSGGLCAGYPSAVYHSPALLIAGVGLGAIIGIVTHKMLETRREKRFAGRLYEREVDIFELSKESPKTALDAMMALEQFPEFLCGLIECREKNVSQKSDKVTATITKALAEMKRRD